MPLALVAAALLVPALASCSSSGTSSAGSAAPSSSPMTMTMPAQHGSSSPAAGSKGVQTVTVHTTDSLRFSPSTIHVHTGTVRVKVVDDGSYPHNLDVTSLGKKSSTVSGDPGNDTTTMTLHFTKPGRYPFVCTYHESAGMKGTFVVS